MKSGSRFSKVAAMIMLGIASAWLLIHSVTSRAADGPCDDCMRRAVLSEVKSNDPREIPADLHSTILSYLTVCLRTPCFHMLISESGGHVPYDVHPPEYLFKADHEIGLNIPRPGQKPIVSRLRVSLYFNGEREEHLQTWVAESTLEDWSSLTNRMFKFENSIMRKVKPIEPLLRDFERRPVSCRIDMRDRTFVKPGEEIDIELTGFLDNLGRPSKPFQRIILQVKEGKILNGEPLEADKDMKVFNVGQGACTVRYRAPESPEVPEDTLYISSSCDVLPSGKYPLSKSEIHGEIAEHRIPIGFLMVMHVEETSSGKCLEYPFSYTIAMDFIGQPQAAPDEKQLGKEGASQISRILNQGGMPPEIRHATGGKDAKLLARLLPDEKSMKVLNWQCSDPENDSPPLAGFPKSQGDALIPNAASELWISGEDVYITGGVIDGIGGFFEAREKGGYGAANPAGTTYGHMKPYIKIPLKQLKKGAPCKIKSEHSGSDGDAWSWRTSWSLTINY